MYDKVRHSPEGFFKHTSLTSEQKLAQEYKKRRVVLSLLAQSAIALSILPAAYFGDTRINAHEEAVAKVSFETILQPLDEENIDAMNIFFSGLDTTDADHLAETFGPSIQQIVDGKVESVNYGNAPLNPETIAELLIAKAEREGVDHISLFGHSMGGIVAIEVAEQIMKKSDLRIDAIILASVPNGADGLRPETKGDLANMMRILSIVPDAEYSTFVRRVVTFLQENSRFTDDDSLIENFFDAIEAWNYAGEQIEKKKRPGVWLMADQALAVATANLQGSISSMGDEASEEHASQEGELADQAPVLYYLRAKENQSFRYVDTVVDTFKSSTNICNYAYDAELNCFISSVPGATHKGYNFDMDAYGPIMAEATNRLTSSISANRDKYAIARNNDFYTTMLQSNKLN